MNSKRRIARRCTRPRNRRRRLRQATIRLGHHGTGRRPATTDEMADDEPAAAGETAAGSVFVSGSSTVEPISIRVGELAGEQSGGA